MSDVNHVTPEQFDAMVSLLTQARKLREKSKNPRLGLAEKLSLQRQSQACSDQARAIGREVPK